MLDFVIGNRRNPIAANELLDIFHGLDLTGTLYLGYPILASLDDTVFIDALLTCEQFGVIAFHFDDRDDFGNIDTLREKQDELFNALEIKFK